MVQENSLNRFAVVICGPTGSGKTALAIELAKKLNGEIISADSIAIYQQLNIGTAKPSVDEQKQAKHHMIDICSPFDNFSVSDYENAALPIIENLFNQNKVPIICGGTGFYIKSLLYDLSYGNCTQNLELRRYYEEFAKEKGAEFVFEKLKIVDPATAEKLHANDLMRVIRALEIFETSGKRKSEIVDSFEPRFKFFAYSYDFAREELYSRINKRVDLMFEKGLTQEVKQLKSLGLTIENQSMQGIGYKEFFDFSDIDGHLEEIKDNIKMFSRRYAKRQITFFKKLDGLKYFAYENAEITCDKILRDIKNDN